MLQMSTNLTHLSIATAVAGITAVAIVAVPLYYHTPPAQDATRLATRLEWPAEPLAPPSNPPFNHIVKTEKYTAVTIVPKSEPPAQPGAQAPQPEIEPTTPHRNICERDGGWRVETRRGGWRCKYPRHHRRRS